MRKPSPSSPIRFSTGTAHVVEVDQARVPGPDAELAVKGAGGQAGHPALEHERGHALVLLRPVDAGEDEEVVGEVGQGDPHLLAVEPVDVAVAAGGRRQVAGVRADARLGQAERGELLATRLRDQPALTLLLGPPLQECQRVEADVDALDDTERGVGTLQLLAQDREARCSPSRRRRTPPGSGRRGSPARPSSRTARDGPRLWRPSRG